MAGRSAAVCRTWLHLPPATKVAAQTPAQVECCAECRRKRARQWHSNHMLTCSVNPAAVALGRPAATLPQVLHQCC